MTLDLDFANVQAYPPKSHPGIVVFRPASPRQTNVCCSFEAPRPRAAATLAKASDLDCRAGPHPVSRRMRLRDQGGPTRTQGVTECIGYICNTLCTVLFNSSAVYQVIAQMALLIMPRFSGQESASCLVVRVQLVGATPIERT